GIVLMENAARAVAQQAERMLVGVPQPSVVIACGGGNNGGDGLAAARHLHNRGYAVVIIECWEGDLRGDAATNFDIVSAMKLPAVAAHDAQDLLQAGSAALIIDALFGTGLKRPIEGDAAQLIARINSSRLPVLAVDVPSGLDCDTGLPMGPACVRAAATVTFVAEKQGFANPVARRFTGEVIVADIGAPPEIISAVLRDCAG
ncbi:MAG: NAD(P)H-hydrate epimerase, partial [Phycisphaerae bacterium]|nr:NAD(P)H-hydrate epimerase [Phycisphaerae bacterium]MDW8262554.1 NAD(P)H-hydrate epimerase [Phycisphaerales bacterium]